MLDEPYISGYMRPLRKSLLPMMTEVMNDLEEASWSLNQAIIISDQLKNGPIPKYEILKDLGELDERV